MSDANLPALIAVVPLIMAAPVAFIPSRVKGAKGAGAKDLGAWLAWLAAMLTCIVVFHLALIHTVSAWGSEITYAMGGWPPPWGIAFISDDASRMMALILSGMSVASTLYAKALIDIEIDSRDHAKTYGAWLLAIGGLLGLVMSADAFNIFVFLEISALASVTLIAMGAGQDRRALMAAYNYLLIGAIGATFYVLGVGFLYAVTGSLNMPDLAERLPQAALPPVLVGLAFIVAGIMVKAAAFPVHIWLPAAYGYAPSAVSALLAAIATKAAIFVMAKLLFAMFSGLADIISLILYWILMPLSLMAMFVGTILAIYESDLKKILAQSSVAQIGYITLAFSLATPTSMMASITAGFIHMANHALIKGGMFMAVGALAAALGKRVTMHSIEGLGRAMPWTGGAMLICGLSLIGLPLTAGFISKVYLVVAALEADRVLVVAMIVVSSVLSVAYFWKIIEVMWMRPYRGRKIVETPIIYIPLWLVALGNIFFGVYAEPVVVLAEAAARVFYSGLPLHAAPLPIIEGGGLL